MATPHVTPSDQAVARRPLRRRLSDSRPEASVYTADEAASLGKRSIAKGIALCATDVVLLATLVGLALALPAWWMQLTASLAAGVMIGILFVVGHDAGHNSLTPSGRLNYWLGQIALLPALHPLSFWVIVHNQRHHRWTNLTPKDYVWNPLTVDQYAALGRPQRMLYRFYRSLAGPLLYYVVEFWWKKIFFPSHQEVGKYKRAHVFDSAIVVAFAVAYAGFLGAGSHYEWFGAGKAWWNAPLYGALIPFAIWNTLMAFVIYLHHTHPDLVWYDDEQEWLEKASQLESAVHVIFPGPINRVFHWIMEHNAHHVRPGIPLYHLPEAQQIIEERAPERVIVNRWSIASHLDIVRRCKLYDYRTHRWMDFAGRYTS